MSFIHYLQIGHFDRDLHGVRFAKSSPREPFRPVVSRPLDATAVAIVLREVGCELTANGKFPDDWSTWSDHGSLICDKYTRNESEIEFLTRIVERTGCTIYDSAAHSEIPLNEWRATVPVH